MQNRNDRTRQGGFTLVEIMVVIVILGLLATIVGTNVLGARDVAEVKKAQTDIKQIQDTVSLYMTVNSTRRIPTLEDLTTPDKNGKVWLMGIAEDPWGSEYVIREGDRGDFEVLSFGPDGDEGTDDDISSKDLTGRGRQR